WAGIVVFAVFLLIKQWGFSATSPIETDILKLLPVNQQNPIAESAFNKVTASMSDKVVFVLSTDGNSKEHSSLFNAAN
ncbi:hypothetical protein, partial [Vibrio alfacsensis]